MGKAVEYNIPFGENKYLIEKSLTYFDFNAASLNYTDTEFKPTDITDVKPFEIIFKHNEVIGINHLFCSTTGTTYWFDLYNRQASTEYRFLYGATSAGYLQFSWSLFTEGEFYKFQVTVRDVSGTDWFDAKMFDIDGNQIGTTQSIEIPATLPVTNIYTSVRYYGGSFTDYYDNQIAYLKGNGEEWYFRRYDSNTIIGSLGTELTIEGTVLENQWGGDYYTPSDSDLWKCLTKFYLKNKLYPAPVTGYIHTILDENYRKFECIVKSCDREQTQLDYSMLKGWEGETITLIPHIDEPSIIYTCKIEFVELLYIDNDTKNWVIVIYLIESTVL